MRFYERTAVSASISARKKTITFRPAYSGGLLYTTDNGPWPTVIDLATCTIEPRIPINVEHVRGAIGGKVIRAENTGREIHATGLIGEGWAADEIRKHSLTFDWKPSIEALFRDSGTREWIAEGETRYVNGRLMAGPFILAKGTYVSGIAVVRYPGDPDAIAVIASQTKFWNRRGNTMTWDDFLIAKGLDQSQFDALSPDEQDALRQEFDSSAGDGSEAVSAEGDPATALQEVANAAQDVLALADALDAESIDPDEAASLLAEEATQVEAIAEDALDALETPAVEAGANQEEETKKAVCAALQQAVQKAFLAGKSAMTASTTAKQSGRTAAKAALNRKKMNRIRRKCTQVLTALRPAVTAGMNRMGNYTSHNPGVSMGDVMLVKMARSLGVPETRLADAAFDAKRDPTGESHRRAERAVNAALSRTPQSPVRFAPGEVNFRMLCSEALASCGQSRVLENEPPASVLRRLNDSRAVMASLGGNSTFDAVSILKQAMQAKILDAAEGVPTSFDKIAKEYSAEDFSAQKFVRANVVGKLEPLVENGSIAHLKIVPETMEASCLNYAAQLTLDMMNMINDRSVGALADISTQLGDVMKRSFDATGWQMINGLFQGTVSGQDGQAFWSSNNSNKLTESESNIQTNGSTAIDKMVEAFSYFEDANGWPIQAEPTAILTTPSNLATFRRIRESMGVNVVDNIGDKQIYNGAWNLITHPFLATRHGGLDSMWIALSNNTNRPAFGYMYVNGFGMMLEEDKTQQLNSWQIGWRLIYPFNVFPVFPDGAVLSTGVADDSSSSS